MNDAEPWNTKMLKSVTMRDLVDVDYDRTLATCRQRDELERALVERLRKYDELLDTCNELTVALRECVEAIDSSLPEDEESDSVPTMKLSEVWARRERARAVLEKWGGK